MRSSRVAYIFWTCSAGLLVACIALMFSAGGCNDDGSPIVLLGLWATPVLAAGGTILHRYRTPVQAATLGIVAFFLPLVAIYGAAAYGFASQCAR